MSSSTPIRQASTHPNHHDTSRQENVTIPEERSFASFPCHHPPSDFHIITDSSIGGGIDDGSAVYLSLVKMTSSAICTLQRAHVVGPSKKRRRPSKKPSIEYLPFHHGLHISLSATANHWLRPSATLTQLTCLQSSYRLQWQYSLCRNIS